MLEDTEFISAVKSNDLINSVIVNNGFSQINIHQFTYEEIWDDHYKFKKFPIGPWLFDYLEIAFRNENIWITLVLNDPVFVDSLPLILGEGLTIETESHLINNKKISETRTKVGKVNIAGKIARVSYLISDLYGAAIKINIINN
ncbi:hypothetical protein G7092_28220 [Mucilaginibacter sp. HC2]|uniref:hypothetical protein n=1 Tax=Mucilaginibacter inviolabilis TaxID=2714892 RepID=UPI00140D4C89|nr:hypothetical protein [Mucilaginibacter inviolabilis]NHA07719.1 hypothetical protein [Mucilaginibacter inviolabilis]